MELSVFLAKFLGLYFLIVAGLMAFRKEQFQSIIQSMVASEGLIAFSGIVSLLMGLAILIGHPIIELNWRGVITLIGLLSFLQGIFRLGFASDVRKMISSFQFEKYHLWICLAMVALGAFLTYFGFIHHWK